MFLSLVSQIINDLITPISYLPYGIIIGTIYLLLRRIVKLLTKETPKEKSHDFVIAFILVYMTVLWILAFFSRESGSRVGVSLDLFSILGTSVGETASYIENILLFVPCSVLFALAYPVFKRFIYNIGLCFSLSVFLEIMQLVTSRGYCQIDDVVANTVGAMIGFVFYKICALIFRKKTSLYVIRNISSYSKILT